MRLAILADIHGNLPAFEAVLKHISGQKPDQVILAGDIVIGSPDSANCWKLAQSLGCAIIRGNQERYVAHYGTSEASPEWASEQYAPLHWAASQLSKEECQDIAKLPLNLRFSEAPDLFVVHATERNDSDTISAHTPVEQLNEMFPVASERFIVRAHNHYGQLRLWGNRYIISNGSVGLPIDGNPTAQYLLIDQNKNGWDVKHQSVPYNVNDVISRFHDSGYLASTGPMGRLFFRELVTATQQIVPFLRLYEQWSNDETITLQQAVERFLSRY